MESWGAARYGQPCREGGFDWPIAVPAAVAFVETPPAEGVRRVGMARGDERRRDGGWSVSAHVSQMADNLRNWAERLQPARLGEAREIPGYGPDDLAGVRSYECSFDRVSPVRIAVHVASMIALVGVLSGCTTSHHIPSKDQSSRPATGAARPLTGFGALRGDWNRTHTEVVAPGCPAGSAYDMDPHLDSYPGCPGSMYVGVDGADDRVEAYQVNFPAGTTPQQTLRAELRELPSDAVRVSQLTPTGCVITQYRSATLARLDPSNIPGGLVAVASDTKPNGRRYLDLIPTDLQTAGITTC